jgi:hypothetical protein
MQKSQLLNWLLEQHQKWQALLDRIGSARMDQPGVSADWSMKDIVAHLTGWNRWLVARLRAAERGEPEPPPPWPAQLQSEDDINAWIYAANHGRSVRDVLVDSQEAYQQLRAVIARLPDDVRIEVIEPAYYLVWVGDQRFTAGEFFYHFGEDHEPDVRAWLAREEKHKSP